MGTFAFRLYCKLAGCHIDEVTREVALNLHDLGPTVAVSFPEPKNDDSVMVFWCGGFPSEDEARNVGVRVKQAVMLAGVRIGVGIDAGNDEVLSNAAKRADGQPDNRLQPNVHGLQIVPDLDNMVFGSIVAGRPVKRVSPDELKTRINEAFELNRTINKKLKLAAQLYNESHFHTADAAQFLTLVSAVEALADRAKRATPLLTLIDELIGLVSKISTLEPGEMTSLKNGLGNLKNESIGAACRALVAAVVGEKEANRFKAMYEIRSKMLHEGEAPPGTDLVKEIRDLDLIVRRLIANRASLA